MTKPLRKGAILETLAEFCPQEAHPILLAVEAMTGT